MVAKKRKSKRITLQKKYKVMKRVKQHHKRLKKGLILGSRKKKVEGGGIPNEWPHKAELLKEIQAAKERLEENKLRQKEKRNETIMAKRLKSSSDAMETDNVNENANTSNELISHEDEDNALNNQQSKMGQNSRRAFLRDLRKIVESADVVLHVLDARDPAGTRSSAIENMVLSYPNKKLIYVLNKVDLIPRNVLIGWLEYLRQFHPCVPFKCNTQDQKNNLARAIGKVGRLNEGALLTQHAVGTEELLGVLKNYCRSGSDSIKGSITVGVVGFPNVGKSSLVNSLMRSRAVQVSSTPGHTRNLQEVILDKNIRLVDSPGIVFADGDTVATSLRNCVNVDEIDDIAVPIQAILERCPPAYLMQLYSIPKFSNNDVQQFLTLVAKSLGKLKKGGVPNIDMAGRAVLHDWNNGKIKYYCLPPTTQNSSAKFESKIVNTFSKELDVHNMKEEDIKVLEEMEVTDDTQFIPLAFIAGNLKESTLDEENNESKSSGKEIGRGEDGNTMNTRQKQKAEKKKVNKQTRRSNASGEQYDFDADFQY